MAKSVNKVILLGHVGKDPEIRSTNGGTLVANLSLATSERYDNEERTEWHNLVAFSRGAEILRDYVKKGSRLYVEGKIQTRSWDDKDTGEKKFRTEVVVFDIALLTPQENSGSSNGNSRLGKQDAKGRVRSDDNSGPDYGEVGITDNDIPF